MSIDATKTAPTKTTPHPTRAHHPAPSHHRRYPGPRPGRCRHLPGSLHLDAPRSRHPRPLRQGPHPLRLRALPRRPGHPHHSCHGRRRRPPSATPCSARRSSQASTSSPQTSSSSASISSPASAPPRSSARRFHPPQPCSPRPSRTHAPSAAPRLLLGTHAENQRAIAFYRRNGFTEAGTRTFQVGTQLCHDLIFAKPIH